MKQFIFDRLVDRENIFNLKREQRLLEDGVAHRDRRSRPLAAGGYAYD